MATLYVSEFRNGISIVKTSQPQMFPQPALGDQMVAIGVASAQSAAFSADTYAVLLSTDAICSIVFGDDPVATAANLRLPANALYPFAVQPGQKVSVIANT